MSPIQRDKHGGSSGHLCGKSRGFSHPPVLHFLEWRAEASSRTCQDRDACRIGPVIVYNGHSYRPVSPRQVNGIAFHPVHGTLATVGSDGRFSFWDKDARTKLKTSEQLDQPISACSFNHNGNIFAYSSSYDWSKVSTPIMCGLPSAAVCCAVTYPPLFLQGHEFYNPQKKNYIFLRNAAEELKPRNKK